MPQSLHLLIIGSDELSDLIRNEYGVWKQPRFRFTSFQDPRRAIRFVSEERCPNVHLAIIDMKVTGKLPLEHFLDIIGKRFPGCPAILCSHQTRRAPEQFTPSVQVEFVEEPADIAELVGATAELSRTGKGLLSRPGTYKVLQKHAVTLLQKHLKKLRAQRSHVERLISELSADHVSSKGLEPKGKSRPATLIPDAAQCAECRQRSARDYQDD